MGEVELSSFLNYLVNKENVSASTQNQALSAIIFLYKQVLNIELGELPEFQYARKPRRLPKIRSQSPLLGRPLRSCPTLVLSFFSTFSLK